MWTYFTPFSNVSIADLEQVNGSLEYALTSIVKLKIVSWKKKKKKRQFFLTGYSWFRFEKTDSLPTLQISLQNIQNFLAANNKLSNKQESNFFNTGEQVLF